MCYSPDGTVCATALTAGPVCATALPALLSQLPDVLPKAGRQVSTILPMRTAEELAVWDRLDDVIMGGQVRSASGGRRCW